MSLDEARTEVVLRKQRLAADGSGPALGSVASLGRFAINHPLATALTMTVGAAVGRFAPMRRVVFAALPIALRLLADRPGGAGAQQRRYRELPGQTVLRENN